MSEQNPYASPAVETVGVQDPLETLVIDQGDRRKIETVIKDAGQFWLAIILCVFCSALGAVIIPIWYLVRLIQWNSLATKYPELLTKPSISGSVASKFQASQWKLITGMVVGCLIFVALVVYVLGFALLAAPTPINPPIAQ